MKPGDAVYFKHAKNAPTRKASEWEFKGHGFGVLLGFIPPFQQAPKTIDCVRAMGRIGFLSFDDVEEFLGADLAAKCLALFEAKYLQQEPSPEPSKIIDPNTGDPAESTPPPGGSAS